MAEFDPETDELLDRKCEAMLTEVDRVLCKHVDLMSQGDLATDVEYMAGLYGWCHETMQSVTTRTFRNWMRAEVFRILAIIRENGNGDESGEGFDNGKRGDDPAIF